MQTVLHSKLNHIKSTQFLLQLISTRIYIIIM